MSEPLHALTTAVLAAAVLSAVWSSAAGARRRRSVWSRTRSLLSEGGAGKPVSGRVLRIPRRPGHAVAFSSGTPAALAAGAGTALLVGGASGVLAGIVAAAGVSLWQRRAAAASAQSREAADRAERVRRQLPLAADLLAACLSAGAGPREAAEAVGRSIGGLLGDLLCRVATELRLGGDPARCWARLGAEPGAAELGRCLERACGSGAPPVLAVSRLAAECRSASARAAHSRARRAAVLATAPLGLCFLPAFLLVGVAPLVIGLASTMLAGI